MAVNGVTKINGQTAKVISENSKKNNCISDDKLFIPDGAHRERAFARTTHLGIGAHSDDLEFMAFDGIIKCYENPELWFGGVICTDGSGSARKGEFENISPDRLCEIRAEEQRLAAAFGKYSFVVQLAHASADLQKPATSPLVDELVEVIRASCPRVIYTHNPADKHPTHVRVLIAVMEALRRLPAESWPEKLIGCEGWRDLDWIRDSDKVVMDVSGHEEFADRINAFFASQIKGGKRYDHAVMGRRRANATFFQAHSTDEVSQAIFGMDLTPLIGQPPSSLVDFTLGYIENFKKDVTDCLVKSL